MKTLNMLALAATALADISRGYHPREIAASNGQGLEALLNELVEHLRALGLDDEGGWSISPEIKSIPVADVSDEQRRIQLVRELRAEGLRIGEAIQACAVPDEDPYVRAARDLVYGSDDVEIDPHTTTSVADEGAWVLSWIWVSNEEAKVETPADHADELSTVLDTALCEQ